MRFFLFLLGALSATTVFAEKLPPNCEDFNIKFEDQKVWLHTNLGNNSEVYLLQNKQKFPIILNHEKRQPNASAGWGSKLDVGHWSAMMVSQNDFSLVCANAKDQEHGWKTLACDQVLTACRITEFTDHGDNRGATFWLAENGTYPQIMAELQKRKIEFTKK